jgi:predicted ATPase
LNSSRTVVWFVDLSPVSEGSLVLPAVAQALGVKESPDQSLQASLERHLADKRILLVIDNFEQVADAASSLTPLLRNAPPLTILVTSRSPLHLVEEEQYSVPPLDVPDPRRRDDLFALTEFEAVRLLLARARAVARGFQPTADAGDLAEVCTALGGLPLAIELAGARLRDFSPAELRQRLETSLDLLVGGPVDAPARQQTVRATLAWSYSLLTSAEQQVFARLAVFAGAGRRKQRARYARRRRAL